MRIGNKEVVYSTGLIMPNNEEAQVDLVFSGERISLGISFREENGPQKNTSRIDAKVVNGQLRLTFVNWNNPIGTATTEPMELGTLKDGRSVFLMVATWSIGTTMKMDLQCLLGQKDS